MKSPRPDFLLDQLRGIRGLRCKAMFGGFGLYAGETFFAIAWRGKLYFFVDDSTRLEYVSRGMAPFRPRASLSLQRYYEVPLDVMENPRELVVWAKGAIKARQR